MVMMLAALLFVIGALRHRPDRRPSGCSACSASSAAWRRRGLGARAAYIAEMLPPRIRGRLGSLQQLVIVTGIFVALGRRRLPRAPAGGSLERARRARGVALDVPHAGGACGPLGALAFSIPESRATSSPRPDPEARKVLTSLFGGETAS